MWTYRIRSFVYINLFYRGQVSSLMWSLARFDRNALHRRACWKEQRPFLDDRYLLRACKYTSLALQLYFYRAYADLPPRCSLTSSIDPLLGHALFSLGFIRLVDLSPSSKLIVVNISGARPSLKPFHHFYLL